MQIIESMRTQLTEAMKQMITGITEALRYGKKPPALATLYVVFIKHGILLYTLISKCILCTPTFL